MRKFCIKATLLLTIVLSMFINQRVIAEPADTKPVEYKQPDGTVVTIKLNGDEKFSWTETLDGYTLLSNAKNGWEYAVHNADGDLVCSGILAHNQGERTNAETDLLQRITKKMWYSPKQIEVIKSSTESHLKSASSITVFDPTGPKNLLLILVEFKDKSLKYGQADFNGLMNTVGYSENGAQGSVHDFFLENSYGKFNLTTDVVGPYKLPKEHDYYGADGTDGTHDVNFQEFALEAVRLADAAGVDFSHYDSDGDHEADGVYIIFQGCSQAHSSIPNDLWSKASKIDYTTTNSASKGTIVRSVSCSNELLYESTNHDGLATIGVICHEFGHVCGAPDFYDTDYGTGGEYPGTGNWDVMCNGLNNGTTSILSGNTPAHINPYVKMMFGWLIPTELTQAGSYTLNEVSAGDHNLYKVNTSTDGEYYLLENRQQTGFNKAIPGHGLMIYHKDNRYFMTGGTGNNKAAPQSFYPVCASSFTSPTLTSAPESYGNVNTSGCPFPGTSNKTSFTNETTPSAKSWDGKNFYKPITNITENNSTGAISFTFMGGACTPPTSQATNLTFTDIQANQMTVNWTRGNGDRVIVLARRNSAVNTTPLNGTTFNANSSFQKGDLVDADTYVIYDGTGTNVTFTDLLKSSTYHFAVFEYNSSTHCYTSNALIGNASTSATTPVCEPTATTKGSIGITNVTFNTINNTSAYSTMAYTSYSNIITDVIRGNTYSLSISTYSYTNTVYTKAWIDWNSDGIFDASTEEYDFGSSTNNAVLTKQIAVPLTTSLGYVTMRVRTRYNSAPTACGNESSSEAEDYTLKIGSACTLPNPATSFTATNIQNEQMTINWTRADGDKVLVVAHKADAVESAPISGTSYSANAVFKAGDELGTGNFVVYNGTGSSVIVTGLVGGTAYHYSIYEYNLATNCYTAALTGNATTTCPSTELPYTDNFDRDEAGCWTVVDNNGNGKWQIGITSVGANIPTLTGSYFYVNTNDNTNNVSTDLISPTFDLTNYSNYVTLSFNHQLIIKNTGVTASVYYSIDDGETWVTTPLATFTASTSNPSAYTSAALSGLKGKSRVKFKWSYIAPYSSTTKSYYWAVDDIKIEEFVENPLTFTALAANSTQINLAWTKNAVNSDVMVAWSPTNTFGTPVDGTDYIAGSSIDGGGTVLYNGGDISTLHAGLTPYTTYYYKIWSKTSGNTYSVGVATYETTDCETAVSVLPFTEDFAAGSLPSCWKTLDHTGEGGWKFGTTSSGSNTPALTGSYAYFQCVYGVTHNYNADLISPSFNLTSYANVVLKFKHLFDRSSTYPDASGTVSYSLDNGATWSSPIATYSTVDSPNPESITLNINAAAGQPQVKFKWNYSCSPTGSYMWAIDDVQVVDNSSYWTGTVSSDWFTAGNWSNGSVPTSSSIVIIPSAPANQPQINATGAVCGDITIQSRASLTMNASTAYTLSVSGNWTNNGTFTAGIGTVEFNGTNALQTIKGDSTTDFYILKVTKSNMDNTLEVVSPITLNATTPEARLQLVSGTFKLSNSLSNIIAINSNGTSTANAIGSGKRIWVNAGTLSVNSSWRLNAGELKITGGVVNVGNADSQLFDYLNNGKLIIQDGELNVSAGIFGNASNSLGIFEISGGKITVGTYYNGFARSSIEISPQATFSMSGGTIVIRRAGTTGNGYDYQNRSSYTNITGGTLQIGNVLTPTSQTIRINSTVPIYNLVVNSTNSPTAQLVTNGLTVKNEVTIGSGAKIDANSLNLSVGGNWTNNGGGLGTAPTGTVLFNGTTAQTLAGSAATTFNNLTLNNSAGMSLGGSFNATVNGVLNFTSGVLTTGLNNLIVGSAGSVSRTSGHVFGNLQKNVATGSSVNRTFEVGDAAELNYTPVTVNFASVTTAGNLIATTLSGDHSLIASSILNAGKSVNRYWTLTNSGVGFTTYDGTFNFLSEDLDASVNTSNLIAGIYASSTWTYPTVGTKTSTSTQITGVASFGDFQLAEGFGKTSNGGNWSADATWLPGGVPGSTDNVLILSPGSITVDIPGAICNDLVIQSGAKLEISAGQALTVNGTLTNNANAANLLIKSDANGTGSLIAASANGSATAERYMTKEAWHLVAAPLGEQTIENFLTANTNIPTKDLNRGMMDYNPTLNDWNSFFTNTTTGPLSTGKGFSLRTDANGVVNFTGTIQTGTQTLATVAGFWNCIGNPYTSAIGITNQSIADSKFIALNAGNLDPSYGAIYVWAQPDASNEQDSKYTAVSNVNTNGINDLQQGQAFFVLMKSGVSTIDFTKEMQLHLPALALKSTGDIWPSINLEASIDQSKGSTTIAFNSNMTNGLDPTYDAGLFRSGSDIALYTLLVNDNGVPFSIQALPDNEFESLIIPVGIESYVGGDLVVSAKSFNLPANCRVILEDKVTATFTDLAKQEYHTTITANTFTSDRFLLHTSGLTTGLDNEPVREKLQVYTDRNGGIRINGSVGRNTVARLYDILGRTVLVRNLDEGSLNSISASGLKTGVYMLQLSDGKKQQGFKLIIKE